MVARIKLSNKIVNWLTHSHDNVALLLTGKPQSGKSHFLNDALTKSLSTLGSKIIYVTLKQRSGSLARILNEALHTSKIMVNYDLKRPDKPTILLIDDIDHALNHTDILEACETLQQISRELNQKHKLGFRLIASASHLSKAKIITEQLFGHIAIQSLPPLDHTYAEYVHSTWSLAEKPSLETLIQAFDLCDAIPEKLQRVISQVMLDFSLTQENIDQKMLHLARDIGGKEKRDFDKMMNALPNLQQAVLLTMTRHPN